MKYYFRTLAKAGISLLLLHSGGLFSQELIDSEQPFKPKTQLLLSASVNAYDKMKIENQGANWLNVKNALGGSFGVGISQTLFSNFSVIIGGELTAIGYRYDYNFISKVQHPQVFRENHFFIFKDKFSFKNLNFGFSYSFNAKILGEKFQPILSIGMKYNRLISFESGTGIGFSASPTDRFDIFRMRMTTLHDDLADIIHFVSYNLKLGLLKQQQKHNTMQFNLLFNYSPEKLLKGTYQFSNLEEASEGTLELNSNYVGVEFVYGFTFFKPKKPKG